MVKIVKATIVDVPHLLAIQRRAFKPLYELYQDCNNPFLMTSSEMLRKISYKYGSYYKVLYEHKLCGAVYSFKMDESLFKIGLVYVEPSLQGKGIAGQAIRLAEKNQPNIKSWEIDFPADQLKNKHCYEKLGYVDTGKRESINDKLTLAYYRKTRCL